MVGDNIKLVTLGINGNKIRIGINAPKEITVHRQEIYEKLNGRKEAEEK